MTQRYPVLITLLMLVLWPLPPALSQPWTEHELRTVTFQTPADWTISYAVRDTEIDFDSPDRRFTLWARWWYPDEPLLGFSDVTHHEERTLAGQRALVITSGSLSERMLQVAFLTPDAEGEQFLFQLIGRGVSQPEHEAMMQALLGRMHVEGVPALAQERPTPRATPLRPEPASGPAAGWFHDPDGDFSLPLPTGWEALRTEGLDTWQVILVAPRRDALVLTVVSKAAPSAVAAQAEQIQRNSIIPRSIEEEAQPRIAGTQTQAIAYTAKVYPINSVALPYDRARAWIYRGETAQRAFLVATLSPLEADREMTQTLQTIAEGLRLGPPPVAATGPVSPSARAPSARPVSPLSSPPTAPQGQPESPPQPRSTGTRSGGWFAPFRGR